MKTIIISVGGSLIVPDDIDLAFLRQLKRTTLALVRKGYRVALITGGGKICRRYQDAARRLGVRSDRDLDWIGIASTRVNGELVRSLFGSLALPRILYDPEQDVPQQKRIVVVGGCDPGWSSDMDAVLLAKNLKAEVVVNLSNIDYVYDKDPRKFKDAKALKHVTWDELLKITGTRWTPGLNAPFDPLAAKRAKALGLTVVLMNGKRLGELAKFLSGKPFRGTVIKGTTREGSKRVFETLQRSESNAASHKIRLLPS